MASWVVQTPNFITLKNRLQRKKPEIVEAALQIIENDIRMRIAEQIDLDSKQQSSLKMKTIRRKKGDARPLIRTGAILEDNMRGPSGKTLVRPRKMGFLTEAGDGRFKVPFGVSKDAEKAVNAKVLEMLTNF